MLKEIVVAVAILVAQAALIEPSFAKGGGSRPHYGGGSHSASHGGHYSGGSGSSHRGGSYKNTKSANRYGTHK
ncbi:MAG: hypothetical protein KGL40_05530 [Rhodocyclaceae bacterium]|nr:hypothetical protein [Rhodocyclaceae bacterium]